MRTILSIMVLSLMTAAFAVPTASAEDICDATTGICVSPCFAVFDGACLDPDAPTAFVKEVLEWAEGQLGPCICDPQPDPW